MKMEFPQLLYLGLLTLGLGMELSKHGEEKIAKHNFWTSLIATIIQVLILKAGGFFG